MAWTRINESPNLTLGASLRKEIYISHVVTEIPEHGNAILVEEERRGKTKCKATHKKPKKKDRLPYRDIRFCKSWGDKGACQSQAGPPPQMLCDRIAEPLFRLLCTQPAPTVRIDPRGQRHRIVSRGRS